MPKIVLRLCWGGPLWAGPAHVIYVTTDDLFVAHPERVPVRPKVGIQPRISDAELLTATVMRALLGYTSETRWLRYARAHLLGMFPHLPGPSSRRQVLRPDPF